MRSDEEIASEIRQTIEHLADLMNEAKAKNIVVNFNINEVELLEKGKSTGLKFRDITIIQKIETL